MKIFAIIGLALAASSLANGLALKGSSGPRFAVQAQQQQQQESLDLQQQEEPQYPPQPYQFSYDTQSEGSQSSRTESGDSNGRVIGRYGIKGADGIERFVSYTADSEGFRANITTNEPGTESQNPSFIILQSSQLPAAEISKQLQTEADLAQQEEQPLEEAAEMPAPAPQPAKTVAAPRKSATPTKTLTARRPAPLPRQQTVAVSAPAKGRRTPQAPQQAAPAKRTLAINSSKGAQRRPTKTVAATPISTTSAPVQRQRAISAPSKRPAALPAVQEQQPEEEAQLSMAADQSEEAGAEDDGQEGF